MKKYFSLFLAVVMAFSIIVPTSAASASRESRSIADDIPKTPAETVDAIFDNHTVCPTNSSNTISESQLSTDDIDEELSHIYLDIYYAEESFASNPTAENEANLTALIDRKDLLEQTMTQRGFIFLSDDETKSLLGDISGADGTPPPDTNNTRYVAAPYSYVTLSDGFRVKYFYVTAYAESPNSNMVRQTMIQMSDSESVIGDFVNSLIQTYIEKSISAAVSLVPGVSWSPYELLFPSSDDDIYCDYSIKATYTTTPRFIWSLSDSLDYYLLDGVTHQTEIEDHHMILFTENGTSHTEPHDEYYTRTTDGWNNSGGIVKDQWETYAPKPHFEYPQHVNYYYQADENNPNSKILVASEKVPYAISYMDMN